MVVHPLESSGKRSRSVRGALPSITVHAAIVLVAVHATAHAAPPSAAPEPPSIVHYVPTAPITRARHDGARSNSASASAPYIDVEPFHAKPTPWPRIAPDHIPAIDSSATPVIDRSEFGPGVHAGPVLGSGEVDRGAAPLTAADVERSVSPIGAAPMPTYPEALRSSGVRGSVTAEFVVDTAGHVEPGSFHALASDNELFAGAVRAAVLRTRFHPAEAGGRRVRQLVQQSFSFVLQ